jgi:hypothetical protein
MGLVGAVPRTRSTWVNANASETESAELRREYEAGLAELATHGLQVVESIGGLVFARVPVARAVGGGEAYSPGELVYPRDPGSHLESMPVMLVDLKWVYTLDTVPERGACCATKKLSDALLRDASPEMALCGSACVLEGKDFCQQHRMFRTTNLTRMILPEECGGFRYGMGHEVCGLKYFRLQSPG